MVGASAFGLEAMVTGPWECAAMYGTVSAGYDTLATPFPPPRPTAWARRAGPRSERRRHRRIAALAAWLESVLTEQADTGEGLLRLPGAEQDGPQAFMQAWIGHLHQLTDRARARRTGAAEEVGAEDVDGARPSTGAPADTGPTGSSTEQGQ
ncbi:hypothetical protein ACSCB1_00035 [Streptomyces europaeiscabiei]|uniref:hypothetical protein n=1 Tax=Streptomyces europaeiscabiei TaxID=146819 RepID=UPI000628638E|nr:hypothetical protein [Streptomyces europaeiscabiei]